MGVTAIGRQFRVYITVGERNRTFVSIDAEVVGIAPEIGVDSLNVLLNFVHLST